MDKTDVIGVAMYYEAMSKGQTYDNIEEDLEEDD